MPFEIPLGYKFACVAMGAGVNHRELTTPVDLANGRWALFEQPFELAGHWREWLGTVQADHFALCNLFLLVVAPSQNPAVLDAENEGLKAAVFRLFLGLLMHGTFHRERSLLLTGATQEAGPELRQIVTLQDHYPSRGAREKAINRQQLDSAAGVADGIKAMYDSANFVRLTKGFNAWRQGFMARYGEERLHQFIRSVEAVIKPATGRTQRQFRHRGKLFAGNSQAAEALLNELYELRSCAEHMNDFGAVLANYPADQRDRMGALRAFQAELLACDIYSRLFKSDTLRQHFASDTRIDAFWKQTWQVQTTTWGVPLDLIAAEANSFTL